MAAGNRHAFQKLVQEAVKACGADIGGIEAYVEARSDAMTPEEREALRRDIELVLGFSEPSAPYKTN